MTLSQLFNMCKTIADKGEGRAAMKLGSDIIGMMERIEVRPAATNFEIVCLSQMHHRKRQVEV